MVKLNKNRKREDHHCTVKEGALHVKSKRQKNKD